MSIVIDKQTRGSNKVPESQAPRAEASSRPYGRVYLIGAGPGDPDLITLKGLRCLQTADSVIYDHLVNVDLLRHARADAELVNVGKRGGEYHISQEKINDLMVERASSGKVVARLKG